MRIELKAEKGSMGICIKWYDALRRQDETLQGVYKEFGREHCQ